jgi:hypothetical protein
VTKRTMVDPKTNNLKSVRFKTVDIPTQTWVLPDLRPGNCREALIILSPRKSSQGNTEGTTSSSTTTRASTPYKGAIVRGLPSRLSLRSPQFFLAESCSTSASRSPSTFVNFDTRKADHTHESLVSLSSSESRAAATRSGELLPKVQFDTENIKLRVAVELEGKTSGDRLCASPVARRQYSSSCVKRCTVCPQHASVYRWMPVTGKCSPVAVGDLSRIPVHYTPRSDRLP